MKIYKKNKPQIGDQKWESKFAFFPKRITDTEIVWLDFYIQHYEYKLLASCYDLDKVISEGEWVETSRNFN